MTRRSPCQSPAAAEITGADRGAPGRDHAAPLRPRGGPCSTGLIPPALLTQKPAAADRSLLRTGPLCAVFSTLAPRAACACSQSAARRALLAHSGWFLVAEALFEVLSGPLSLAGAVSLCCRRGRRFPPAWRQCNAARRISDSTRPFAFLLTRQWHINPAVPCFAGCSGISGALTGQNVLEIGRSASSVGAVVHRYCCFLM